eukprot:3337762-Amphidinium_carterae.1
MISENGKNVVLARLNRKCGRQRGLLSLSGSVSSKPRSCGTTSFGHGRQLACVLVHACTHGHMCAHFLVNILHDAFDVVQTYYARRLHDPSQACIVLGQTASAVMQVSSPPAAAAAGQPSEGALSAAVLHYPLQSDLDGSLQFADVEVCASLPNSAGADVMTHTLHAAHDHTSLDDYLNRLSLQEIVPKPLMPGISCGEQGAGSMGQPRTIDVSGATFLGKEHGEASLLWRSPSIYMLIEPPDTLLHEAHSMQQWQIICSTQGSLKSAILVRTSQLKVLATAERSWHHVATAHLACLGIQGASSTNFNVANVRVSRSFDLRRDTYLAQIQLMEQWLRQRRVHVVYMDPGELTLHWESKWTRLSPVFPQCFPSQMWRRAEHGSFLFGSRASNVPEVLATVQSEPQAAGAAGSHDTGIPSQGGPVTAQTAGAVSTVPKISELQSGFLLSDQIASGYAFMRHGIYLASEVDEDEQAMCNFEVSFVRLLNTHKGTGH